MSFQRTRCILTPKLAASASNFDHVVLSQGSGPTQLPPPTLVILSWSCLGPGLTSKDRDQSAQKSHLVQ